MLRKFTIQDVRGVVESEGLGYALTNYVPASRIEDQALRHAWNIAQAAIKTIESILETNE